MSERNRGIDKHDQGIGLSDDAPIVMNHGEGSYGLKGVNAGTPSGKFDQTDNKGTAEASAGRLSNISKEAKHG